MVHKSPPRRWTTVDTTRPRTAPRRFDEANFGRTRPRRRRGGRISHEIPNPCQPPQQPGFLPPLPDYDRLYRQSVMEAIRRKIGMLKSSFKFSLGVCLEPLVKLITKEKKGRKLLRTVHAIQNVYLFPSRRYRYNNNEKVRKIFGDLDHTWNSFTVTTPARTHLYLCCDYIQFTHIQGISNELECKGELTKILIQPPPPRPL